MNIKNIIKASILLVAIAFVSSCAKEVDESSEDVQKRILEAYMNENYPDIEPTESGIYIIDSVPGTGIYPIETSYVRVDYVVTYLDGTYSSYNSEDIAKQLGTYTEAGFYDPVIWSLENSSEGIVEILTQTKTGGRIKAIIPASLDGEESSTSVLSGTGANKIYDITLYEVFSDIDAKMLSELDAYARQSYPEAMTVEKGLYMQTLTANPTDTVADNNKVYVKYVGRYLDGRVFDTNVQDTAKKYGLYSAQNDYDYLDYKHYENIDDAINNNSLVQGFTIALWYMNYGEHAYTFFYYDLGYGESNSGNIPAYTPLFFEIWTHKTDDE